MISRLGSTGIYIVLAVLGLMLSGLVVPQNVYAESASTRIINGKIVPPGKYPWMVAIADPDVIDRKGVRSAQFCGGTLIDRQWVLTAAHCVRDRSAERVAVIANVVNLGDPAVRRLPVAEILVHSWFVNYGNRDVALLKLKRPLAADVPTLKLIENGRKLEVGTKVTTMGWGWTERAYRPNRLTEVDFEVDYLDVCENYSTRFYTAHELCLTSPRRNTMDCAGDSGGPSIIKDESSGEYRQVGIVSWGDGNCDTHYASVHTRLSGLVGWISRQINDRAQNYEKVSTEKSFQYYCPGLECFLDAAGELYPAVRYIWRTDDGGKLAGSGETVFKHRFSSAGDHKVRLTTIGVDGERRQVELQVKVEDDRAGSDRRRRSYGGWVEFENSETDWPYVFYQAGQGTWFYEGRVAFYLSNYESDFDLELWKYDFETKDWQLIDYSARSGTRFEKIVRQVENGFYYLKVVTNGQAGFASVFATANFSRRDVCRWDGFLRCRPAKEIDAMKVMSLDAHQRKF